MPWRCDPLRFVLNNRVLVISQWETNWEDAALWLAASPRMWHTTRSRFQRFCGKLCLLEFSSKRCKSTRSADCERWIFGVFSVSKSSKYCFLVIKATSKFSTSLWITKLLSIQRNCFQIHAGGIKYTGESSTRKIAVLNCKQWCRNSI